MVNIWPAELENVISNLEGVREVVVVAAPMIDREEPVAVVVVNNQHQVTSEKYKCMQD